MVKVSVVLPVYNVENYLRDCLDSIVNQTLTDIEIICINDGSPDNSLEILREYEKKDDRITVIDQENGGHAVATNRGIDLATGECLFSMDSDDILELNALELSYNRLKEKDVDFVMFKAINYDDTNDKYYETEVYSMGKIYSKVGDEVFNYQDIGELMFEASVTPWSKLYKREFIMDNNIRYPEGLIFEDNVFFYKALLTAKRICFLNEFLFIRRWYATSSTTNGDLRFLNSIDVSNLVIDVFKEHDELDQYKSNLFNNKISLNFMRYNKIRQEFKETYFQTMKEDFSKLLNDEEYFDSFFNSLTYRNKKIYEQIVISENSNEFEELRKLYNKQMKNYNYISKTHVLSKIIRNEIKTFESLTDEEKVKNYGPLRDNFYDLLNDKEIYDAIIINTPYKYKKIFEQVLISETYYEYSLLRKVYTTQTKKYKQSRNIVYKHSKDLLNLLNRNRSNIENIFNYSKGFFIELLDNEILYDDVINKLSYKHKKILEQLYISEDYLEFLTLRKIYSNNNNKKNLHQQIEYKEVKLNEVKEFNDSLINSNSWKLTKIFRMF